MYPAVTEEFTLISFNSGFVHSRNNCFLLFTTQHRWFPSYCADYGHNLTIMPIICVDNPKVHLCHLLIQHCAGHSRDTNHLINININIHFQRILWKTDVQCNPVQTGRL